MSDSESDYDLDLDLEPYSEHITERIFNDEINPDIPTEDVENNVGYLFLYYLKMNRRELNLRFIGIPDTWEQWATTFADLMNPLLYETQFVGELRDRDLVESILRQQLERYVSEGKISDYRIRRNYISGYS